jgi:CubicO group peptidase (beta-lactamase class C family)
LGSPSFYEDNPTYLAAPSALPRFPRAETPAEQGLEARLLDAGAHRLEETPSARSFLVLRGGVLVTERYFHGSEANHSDNIHSASKGILSALVGVLVQRGLVTSLDERLAELLPPVRWGSSAKADITLRHLLTMSAGFTWVEDQSEYAIEKQANWVQAIVDLPLGSPPGERFHYCTAESHLVSAVIAERTGMTTRAFAEQHLFEPLGVTVEHWGRDPQGIHSGGYNFYMTPRSLAKFALLVLHRGREDGRQILPAAWVDESLHTREPVDDAYQYGYYWWNRDIGGHAVHKLWGYGGQFAYLIPDADLVVVITNDTRKTFPEMDGDDFVARYVVPALIAPTRP